MLVELVRIHKALGHPVRLRIVGMLRGGPLCVCQLTAVLGLAPSTVSAHLSDLRRADIVGERKEGKWVEYRLTESGPGREILDTFWSTLEEAPEAQADAVLIRELRRVSVDELCRVGLDLGQIARPKLASAVARAAQIRAAEGARR